MNSPKKLIEVALPLEAINRESAKEKSIRQGHPSTLHLWWARRPLAACRAVLFSSLVDDPSSHPDRFPTLDAQDEERQRLFAILERLVKWESGNDQDVLETARKEIRKSCPSLPTVVDPFCGGGAIPLEAQRLGLQSNASDLNPVAVLITRALVEIPIPFTGRPPVNSTDRDRIAARAGWKGAAGLASDVLYYGAWMRSEAKQRIGHLYPKATLAGGDQATVIAWIWARTVKCPNPACGGQMPLVHSLWLSKKKDQEVWLEAQVDRLAASVKFVVRNGTGRPGTGTVSRTGARCIICGTHVPFDYIRSEGRSGRMAQQLLAIVAEGPRGRTFLEANEAHVAIASSCSPGWAPETELPKQALGFRVQRYGFTKHRDLFTPRQLIALTTYSELLSEAHGRVVVDAEKAGYSHVEAVKYADATLTYLALALSRLTDICNAFCPWEPSKTQVRNLFRRQAISMLWDFGENNVFAEAAGDFIVSLRNLVKVLETVPCGPAAAVVQRDAVNAIRSAPAQLICTDPPYYDNISYADLADFFYVWLRRPLISIYPDLFSTVLTPKNTELIASPYRFDGDRTKANRFFEDGLGRTFAWMREVQNPDFPLTVFYAFKQLETEEDHSDESVTTQISSTGWETMLEALIGSGLTITGTWPMRTEQPGGLRERGRNALASSIVLVCRLRQSKAALTTRRDFLSALKMELPDALRGLQRGNIAPVDLAQAAIGPGMAVFSRYSKVLEADGSPMTVRSALGLINQALDEVVAEQEGEYDPATRWAVAWFDQYGTDEGPFGVAETLSKAKNTSVSGLVEAGFLRAKGGKVRLLRRDELDAAWDPISEARLTVWEATQQLIRSLQSDGEYGASVLARKLGPLGDVARDLSYRLYLTCDRRGWTQDALAYNSLVVAWPEISRLASGVLANQVEQTSYV